MKMPEGIKAGGASREIGRSLNVSTRDLRNIVLDFNREMVSGLSGRPSSLKMIPTYVTRPTGDEKGEFIALDLGGTNFRVLELKLKGGGVIGKPKVMKFTLKAEHITGKADDLFGFLADCIKTFVAEEKIVCQEEMKLGFTFSFPVEQAGVASGRLLGWTKGFSVSGVVGKDVAELLGSALKKRGMAKIRVAALANDTVGTLASRGYKDRSCDIGVIIGTGTNACYLERLSQVTKWDGPRTRDGHMIINTEWGNFNRLRRTAYDKELDANSDKPGRQILEKMISGMYLGELARIVIKDTIARGSIFSGTASPLFSKRSGFKTEYMSLLESDRSKRLSGIGSFLEDAGIVKHSLNDRKTIKQICEIVSRRGARISAAVMAAIVLKMDPLISRAHTIAIDGTVYEKHPGYSKNIKSALGELFGRRSGSIKIVLAKDGSGKGAAIIAAIA